MMVSDFRKMNPQSYYSKMKHKIATEFLSLSFENIYNKKWPPKPARPQIRNFQDFTEFSIGETRATIMDTILSWKMTDPIPTQDASWSCHAWSRQACCMTPDIVTHDLGANRKSYGNSRKNGDLGSDGVWGVGGIFIANFAKRIARKLRRTMLLHFWATKF